MVWLYLSVGILLPRRSSISNIVLDHSIYNKEVLLGFSSPRGFLRIILLSRFLCLVYLSVDLFNVICKRTLTYKNINMVSELS